LAPTIAVIRPAASGAVGADDQVDQIRRAEHAGDDADRVPRPDGELADEVGHQHEERADQRGGDEQRAVPAHDPGRDRPGEERHEGDRAARRRREGDQADRRDDGDQPGALDADAQRRGGVVAELQGGEVLRLPQQHGREHDQGHQRGQHRGPGRAVEAAGQPAQRLLVVPLPRLGQDVGGDAGEHGADADADQDEPGSVATRSGLPSIVVVPSACSMVIVSPPDAPSDGSSAQAARPPTRSAAVVMAASRGARGMVSFRSVSSLAPRGCE
jgi:hypothetical protein